MRSSMDIINLKPTDEKLKSKRPSLNKVSQDMNGLTAEEQKSGREVMAIFRDKTDLEKAVQKLLAIGITGRRMLTFNCEQGNFLDHPEALIESKLGEGGIAGGVLGLIVGAICGFSGLVGFGSIANLVAFQNPFGPFAVTVGFGLIGGILGAMVGRLIPQYKVEAYETSLPDGYILLVVKDVTGAATSRINNAVTTSGGMNSESYEDLKTFKKF